MEELILQCLIEMAIDYHGIRSEQALAYAKDNHAFSSQHLQGLNPETWVVCYLPDPQAKDTTFSQELARALAPRLIAKGVTLPNT